MSTEHADAARLNVVAIADSDSYVKWSAALVGSIENAAARVLVVETPLSVSPEQEIAALAGSSISGEQVERVRYSALAERLRQLSPDAVVVAGKGPLVRILVRQVERVTPRPVIVMGMPGISIPAQRGALHYRHQADLLILHSHREIRAFTELGEQVGISLRYALATLPFARPSARHSRGTDAVFAAQAIVPGTVQERLHLARVLRESALRDPSRRVVVKLRSRPAVGERETHHEIAPIVELIESLGPVPENLVYSYGSMQDALDTAEGLVTVSSTAAIEAIARGIPVLALDTFGVTKPNLNTVFIGSGLLGSAEDLAARRFAMPGDAWRVDNYFHPPSDETWQHDLRELVERRRSGTLPPRAAPRSRGGWLRRAWDRKRVLGSVDRTFSGTLAFALALPVRTAIVAVRRARGRRASVHSWNEVDSDITLTSPQHDDPLRRG